ncbi:TetR family transcriptional regulator [Nocardia tengchongensis]|uniref:TetR family transcriptional regulator n=1 Tax=Nocardia tengchongensis TaxID=2055889 RepID=UPI0036B0D47F
MIAPTRAEPGLNERRKLQAMHEIQHVALKLFEDNEYREVSVEQVAAAAGVSASTVYRYFGTKEMLVVWDDIDPRVIGMLAAGGEAVDADQLIAQVITGARHLAAAVAQTGDELTIKRRMRLMRGESDIRAGQLRQVQFVEEQVRKALTARLGLHDTDLLPRILAAQSIWPFMAAIDHWVATDFAEPLGGVLDETINIVQRSLHAAVASV